MQLGDWHLTTVSGGTLWLDGGAMFGVVPKPLWRKAAPPDEQNRIEMATNCVLARNGRATVLIDTGYGGKQSDKEREFNRLEEGEPLVAGLHALGVDVHDIDVVALSHLHFDHAGGGTRRHEDGRLVPTFPRARYVVSRIEWEDATAGAPELRGSYPPEHVLPLAENGQLDLVEGEVEIMAGLRTLPTPGHTRGHHSLVLESGGQTAIYIGDLCPMTAHLRTLWCMGFDMRVIETRRLKPQVLGRAADDGWLVMWCHDPRMAAARLARDAKHDFVVRERFERL